MCVPFLYFFAFQPGFNQAAGPDVGSTGAACMHGDMESSDTTPLSGPGFSDAQVDSHNFLSACPTILVRSDGYPFVLSTSILTRSPVARILDPETGNEMGHLSLNAGSLLGGVYAYLDSQDRLVMVDGDQNLIRIKARRKKTISGSKWSLFIEESLSLLSVTDHCGSDDCDAVVSINAGADGTLWFVTQQAVAGIVSPETSSIQTLKLGIDERIDNSFSTTSDGRAAIVTNKALYLLKQQEDNTPQVIWRHEYDNGSARKPGQLSHGSGSTPTFFGPVTGTDYVTITDNADNCISLIVRDAQNGSLLCQKEIFTCGVNSGTENSAIGIGNTVIVASTYGYTYPKLPEGAEVSIPEDADFVGGMVRVDLGECPEAPSSCLPCKIVWENTVRSVAVPKLSTGDGYIYTVERQLVRGQCPDRHLGFL